AILFSARYTLEYEDDVLSMPDFDLYRGFIAHRVCGIGFANGFGTIRQGALKRVGFSIGLEPDCNRWLVGYETVLGIDFGDDWAGFIHLDAQAVFRDLPPNLSPFRAIQFLDAKRMGSAR